MVSLDMVVPCSSQLLLHDLPYAPTIQDLGRHAGHYVLPRSRGARMFYFFFESRTRDKDPVVIWLTEGPGVGDEIALFEGNGPFHIAKDNTSLVWNDYGWDKVANLIYVDQPIGTGFSYVSDDRDICQDEECVSTDLYDFLQAFFKDRPGLAKNPFYITGESYAGHYIPAFASQIHRENKAKNGIHVNLKGFAIGNGITNSEFQYPSYIDYALLMGLIQMSDYERMNKNLLPPCIRSMQVCDSDGGEACNSSYNICNEIYFDVLRINKDINPYDVRKKCVGEGCYDHTVLFNFLRNETVRQALGVGNTNFSYMSCNVYSAMVCDQMRNLDVGIPALLEDGIRVLIYAGDYDFMCNWLGNWRWVHALKWSGQEQFGSSPTIAFEVDGAKAGEMKSHGPFTFSKVYNAGHKVPIDQPKASLQMLTNWIDGKLV